MEARQIRRRHIFHSSVGSLLNENYNPALSPVSVRTSHRPLSRSQCNSVDGSSRPTHIDTPDNELPSDLHEVKDNGRLDAEALSHKSNVELNNEALLNRYPKGPSAISVTSSGSCLGEPRMLGENKSTLTWPEYNGQTSRQSTPSCATTSGETETYRPFSSTTNDFIGGKFRFSPVATPQSLDHSAKLEPPQYYDAYREIMKAKSHSSMRSVTQGERDIDTLAKIEFPCNLQVTQEPDHSTRRSQRAFSSHYTGRAQRDSINRLVTPASSRVHLQKCVNTPPFISDQRKSSIRSSSAASMSSLWNQQEPDVFYTGTTPSRTPSPDYRLPVFPSQAWIKHYSPTYIRHFMRAAKATKNN